MPRVETANPLQLDMWTPWQTFLIYIFKDYTVWYMERPIYVQVNIIAILCTIW